MKPAHVLGNQSTKTMLQFFDVSRAVDPHSFFLLDAFNVWVWIQEGKY